jgi:hypothetical protein
VVGLPLALAEGLLSEGLRYLKQRPAVSFGSPMQADAEAEATHKQELAIELG